MNKYYTSIILALAISWGQIRVVTSTTDLADIASQIGGKQVSVTSIARGDQDPHFIEVLPSYMMKVKKADLYFQVGMEMDLWSLQIIDGSRNRKLEVIDCSENIQALEIPSNKVDARMGDIHRFGNPHYWLDPENGILIAQIMADAFSRVDPLHQTEFQDALDRFTQDLHQSLETWRIQFAQLNGMQVIFYHNSWPYFTNRFGLSAVQFIEPKPGIMPTPRHLEKLLNLIQSGNISAIALEPCFSEQAPEYLSQRTGVRVVRLAQSVNALPEADSYQNLFSYNLKTLLECLNP